MTAPMNANEVVLNLADLGRQLDAAVRQLRTFDEDSVRARARYEVLFARHFLNGNSSVDARKQQARLDCEKEWLDAEIADQKVRSQKALISSLGVRIDIGRSYGSAIKAEMALAGAGHST
jgi:hypothetical protein